MTTSSKPLRRHHVISTIEPIVKFCATPHRIKKLLDAPNGSDRASRGCTGQPPSSEERSRTAISSFNKTQAGRLADRMPGSSRKVVKSQTVPTPKGSVRRDGVILRHHHNDDIQPASKTNFACDSHEKKKEKL